MAIPQSRPGVTYGAAMVAPQAVAEMILSHHALQTDDVRVLAVCSTGA